MTRKEMIIMSKLSKAFAYLDYAPMGLEAFEEVPQIIDNIENIFKCHCDYGTDINTLANAYEKALAKEPNNLFFKDVINYYIENKENYLDDIKMSSAASVEDTDLMKSAMLIRKFAVKQGFDLTALDEFINYIKDQDLEFYQAVYRIGNEYWQYLDESKFGIRTNSVGVVGRNVEDLFTVHGLEQSVKVVAFPGNNVALGYRWADNNIVVDIYNDKEVVEGSLLHHTLTKTNQSMVVTRDSSKKLAELLNSL